MDAPATEAAAATSGVTRSSTQRSRKRHSVSCTALKKDIAAMTSRYVSIAAGDIYTPSASRYQHSGRSRSPRRLAMLTIRREQQQQALQAARQRERTKAFQKEYDRRAGIEATIARGVRTSRLRRTPYIGLERTHLGHLLTAVGLNWLRLGERFLEIPRAKTRRSPFTRLMAPTSAT